MKFNIQGVDAKTGADRTHTVEADTEDLALARSRDAGIYPYRVDIQNEPVETIVFTTPQTPESQAAQIVFICSAIVFVVILGGFIFVAAWFRNISSGSHHYDSSERTSTWASIYPGRTYTVKMSCFAARDEATFDRAVSVAKSKDTEAVAKMMLSGEMIDVRAGTRVEVIEYRMVGGNTKVRVQGDPNYIWLAGAWLE